MPKKEKPGVNNLIDIGFGKSKVEESKPKKEKKESSTFALRASIKLKLKRAAYWEREEQGDIVAKALEAWWKDKDEYPPIPSEKKD